MHRHRDLLAADNRTSRAVASMGGLSDLEAVLEQESARESFCGGPGEGPRRGPLR
ncbi:hypothetical protein [Pseudonocardia humida]|uniref:Uncharacterized protein n=1 Tax=Pseudonocardia humida TaxID=2800819 RepID=A0ABT0ZTU5_9PSEU|nr:hypothetical protein [Pseudonocardia humida]MCO1654151.1 hypothetical protein [Pseudonocardia humida]